MPQQRHALKHSTVACISTRLPPMERTKRLLAHAEKQQFTWDSWEDAAKKVAEELNEVKEAIQSGDRQHTKEELGDLIHASITLAVHEGVDPEAALASTNDKWTQRFAHMQARLRQQGKDFSNTPRSEYMKYWQEAKIKEQNAVGANSQTR
ncbi:MAG: MazG nucleotide pyrophosphohydrolase domain-containing protein [Rickettsiales bacterium]